MKCLIAFLKGGEDASLAWNELHEQGLKKAGSTFSKLVIGGGISGILVALRHSQGVTEGAGNNNAPTLWKDPIALADSEETLGGRLNFSVPHGGAAAMPAHPAKLGARLMSQAMMGASTDESEMKTWVEPSESGFPLSVLNAGCENLSAELSELLTSSERDFLVRFCRRLKPNEACVQRRSSPALTKAFAVKKERVSGISLLSGPSETLTRKASAQFMRFFDVKATTVVSKEVEGEVFEKTVNLALADTDFWELLTKSEKEELKPYFEAVAGVEYKKVLVADLQNDLRFLFDDFSRNERAGASASAASEQAEELSDAKLDLGSFGFGRIAKALEVVLRSRGVVIITKAQVKSVKRNKKPAIYLSSLLCAEKGFHTIESLSLCVAVPLAQAVLFLPREFLHATESKMTMKIRPRSLVALEVRYPDRADEFLASESFHTPVKMLFPVERTLGVVTPRQAPFDLWLHGLRNQFASPRGARGFEPHQTLVL